MGAMQSFAQLQQQHCRRWLVGLLLLLFLSLVISLCAGDSWIGPQAWLSARGELFVWQIRLPRTLAVLLVPACALAGTSVLLLADITARLLLPSAELPIGVVTATLGAPVFIWLLLRTRQ